MSAFNDLISGDKPVLADFSADWCGPCKMMAPILSDLKSKLGDKAVIIKIDVDKNPQVANAYQVQSVPTLIVFHKGNSVWRHSGVMQAAELERVLNRFFG